MADAEVPRLMRATRLLVVVAVCAVAVVVVSGRYDSAAAAPGGGGQQADTTSAGFDQITIDATLEPDGTMNVTETLDVQFGSSTAGPPIYFTTRQRWNDHQDILFSYKGMKVAAASKDVPTKVRKTAGDDYVRWQIDPPPGLTGTTQKYVVTYKVSGVLSGADDPHYALRDPRTPGFGLDMLVWTPVGTHWPFRISHVTVTVHGPAGVSQAVCSVNGSGCLWGPWTGPTVWGSPSGSTVTYTPGDLYPGNSLLIVAGWPAGTFPGAHLVLAPASKNPFTMADGGGWSLVAGVALAVGAGLLVAVLHRRGRVPYSQPDAQPAEGDPAEAEHDELPVAAVEPVPPSWEGACEPPGRDQRRES